MLIIITGMHRSGTSMVAKMLNTAGLYMGEDQLLSSSMKIDNPHGYWEYETVVKLHDDLLDYFGSSWSNPPDLEDGWYTKPEIKPFVERGKLILSNLGHNHAIFSWKDPRASIFIDFWLAISTQTKFIICVRNPIEVAMSLSNREKWAIPFENALNLWGQYYKLLTDSLEDQDVLVTHYHSYFYDGEAEVKRIIDFVNIEKNEDAIQNAVATISNDLYRNHISNDALDILENSDEIKRYYSKFAQLAGPVFSKMQLDDQYLTRTKLDYERRAAKERIQLSMQNYEIEYIKSEHDKAVEYIKSEHDKAVEYLESVANKRDKTIEHLDQKIQIYESSRTWRFAMRIAKLWVRLVPKNSFLFRSTKQITYLLSSPISETEGVVNKKESLNQIEQQIQFVSQKTSPLKLSILKNQDVHFNILIGTIDFKYLFGGYIAVFNIALMLNNLGYKVRMILVDPCEYRPDVWREEIQKYEGIEHFFDVASVVCAYDRDTVIEVSSNDIFMATSWWTAYIADAARKQLEQDKFVYLTQDYEPIFYPGGTFYALAASSYTLPHYAIYSTEILRKYARHNKIGVYAHSNGDDNSIAMQNAIGSSAPSLDTIQSRTKYKLLFYARPEDHAMRNAFVMGVVALIRAIQSGYFNLDEWEFYGIGIHESVIKSIPLTDNTELKLLPKVGLKEYYEQLQNYDLGLALMMTPHPSLLPLDMAASGMVVVTNTFATKTSDDMSNISQNIIATEPSISALCEGLKKGVELSSNHKSRIDNANINWATQWDETFTDEMKLKIKKWTESINRSL